MVTIEKRPRFASFAENVETLPMICYNNLIPNKMGPFQIFSIQSNTLTIDEHGFHIIVSTDFAALAPGNKSPTNAS